MSAWEVTTKPILTPLFVQEQAAANSAPALANRAQAAADMQRADGAQKQDAANRAQREHASHAQEQAAANRAQVAADLAH